MPVAVALGAEIIEFHVTLNRSMYGSDHPSSFEPEGVMKLRKYIDGVEQAMGDGVKQVYASEIPIKEKLRR
jgi:N-acetylneuraminate synthase